MTVTEVLQRTNWTSFAEQKFTILTLLQCMSNMSGEDSKPVLAENLEGLLNFLDALQDAASDDGHPVVYLTEAKEYVP